MACLSGRGILPDYPKATEPVDIKSLAGTYMDLDMPICRAQVKPIGPCLGVCLCLGPVPFTAACAGPSGPNCYTNYQGFYITVVDQDTLVSGYLCCNGVLKKVAPQDPKEKNVIEVTITVDWTTPGLCPSDPNEDAARKTLEQVLSSTYGITLPEKFEWQLTIVEPGRVFAVVLRGADLEESMVDSIQVAITEDESNFKTTWAAALLNDPNGGDVISIGSIGVVVTGRKAKEVVEEETPAQEEMKDGAEGAGGQEIGEMPGEGDLNDMIAEEAKPMQVPSQEEMQDGAQFADEQDTGARSSEEGVVHAAGGVGDLDEDVTITSI